MSLRWPFAALLCTTTMYLVACPYSKVEESFNLQAVHDTFYYGVWPALEQFYGANAMTTTLPYDHLQFPGVVPRTFLGPILMSTGCQLVRFILYPLIDLAQHALSIRFLARFLLLLLTLSQWYGMADALERRQSCGGRYLLLLTAAQFHLPFYASRCLPNTLATILTLRSYTHWLRRTEPMEAAVDMVLAAALVRCDCSLLLFTCGLSWLTTRQLTIGTAVLVGISTVVVGGMLTVPLDSALWQRWTWPEIEVLLFNTVQNQSSQWGVSAWHWYWTAALPKAMMLTALSVPLSVLRLPEAITSWNQGHKIPSLIDWTWAEFLFPALGFVGLYSFLGHKEVRFLFPALPLFNLAAAVGLSRLHRAAFPSKQKCAPLVARILHAGAIATLLLSWIASMAFVAVSRHNYPGGQAMERLVDYVLQTGEGPPGTAHGDSLRVHIDVASAMSGVSLFEQRAAQQRLTSAGWSSVSFDKAGYEKEHDTAASSLYDYLLTEEKNVPGFSPVAIVQGHPRWDLRQFRVATREAIYVQRRYDEQLLN